MGKLLRRLCDLIEDQLPIRQAAAIAKCRDDRQADLDAAANAIDAAYYPAMQAELLLGQAEDALAAAEKDLADCNKPGFGGVHRLGNGGVR